jgi:alanyl-tRNA synthetase
MSDLTSEYQLAYFDEEGFTRTACSGCGAHFWSRDADRERCGEPPCGEYTFIDEPALAEDHTLAEMREAFLSYFESEDHGRIDPYPVAANRWRDDVLLTQASIYDFQPLVTSGQTPPPANPLTISQPCIRMQDIDNVGKTGRHTMAFEMMAHHAFNAREDVGEYAYEGEVYWKDRTVELCEGFFETLGADLSEITFIEDPWVGGGNAGPAIEVIYRGLELATLVFMSMEQDPDGEYELKDGNRYSPMDTYVVDTGYGLERWTWMSQGTPTVYEAVYPEMIAELREQAAIDHSASEDRLVRRAAMLSGNMDIDETEDVGLAREAIAEELDVEVAELRGLLEPLEAIYAIADHCRTLAYMLGDGIVPSNVGTGYLARMVLRRTERLVEELALETALPALVDMQAQRLGYQNRSTIREIVTSEVEKFEETLARGGRRVEQLAARYAEEATPIPVSELIELYDSHGIQPETVAEIAAESGATVRIPDDFYGRVAGRHTAVEAAEETDPHAAFRERLETLPATEKLFYDDQSRGQFEAVVLEVIEREPETDGEPPVYDVALDQTMFYPEGGGQPADHGTLVTDSESIDVTDVVEVADTVLHRTETAPEKGEFVNGQIDTGRRRRLMAHHTATHIVGHAARKVLGEHVRQAGAQKGEQRARLDISHYARLDRADREAIERRANELVRANVQVSQEWLDRNEAQSSYGFDLFQGGIPPGTEVRVISVGEDVQACAGTHVGQTGDIGLIRLRGTERVQDGVERLVFSAGEAAVERIQTTAERLAETAESFDVTREEVPETAARFFEEWKERGKRIETLKTELATLRAEHADAGEEVQLNGADTSAVVQRLDGDMEDLRATANAIAESGQVAVLGSGVDGATFVVSVPGGVPVNAGEVVGALAAKVGGGGGGPADFAQGGGPDVGALDDALAAAPSVLRQAVES